MNLLGPDTVGNGIKYWWEKQVCVQHENMDCGRKVFPEAMNHAYAKYRDEEAKYHNTWDKQILSALAVLHEMQSQEHHGELGHRRGV